MLVRFLGFSFSTNASNLSLNDYIEFMIARHGKSHQLGSHERFMFINTTHSKKYYVGLFVTVKDQKTYCELVQKSGKLVVKVSELDGDSSLMDFNFFVINKTTGLGMYQYYHQSCSLSSFGYFNYRRFTEYRESKVEDGLATPPEEKQAVSGEKAIRKYFRGNLKWEILVRKEKLKEMIEQLKRVKAFEYTFTELTAQEPEFKPLKNFVKKERTKLSFSATSPVQLLAGTITNIVRKVGIDQGKVMGIDEEGIERVLRLTNNPDNYGEYEYDDVAPKINALEVSEFEKSWVIQELLDKCQENKHIFEVKAK